MSAPESASIQAIAFQLAAALEQYEDLVAELASSRLDLAVYREVSEAMDRIQRFSAAIPELSVPVVSLLISHTDLVVELRRVAHRKGPLDGEDVARRWDEHRGCVELLRRRCLGVLRGVRG